MQLLGKNIIDKFKKKHPSSRKTLERWVKLIEMMDFSQPQDIKNLFGSTVDFIRNQTVFDVGGNKVRTITKVQHAVKIILVTHVLTHAEYDRERWKNI